MRTVFSKLNPVIRGCLAIVSMLVVGVALWAQEVGPQETTGRNDSQRVVWNSSPQAPEPANGRIAETAGSVRTARLNSPDQEDLSWALQAPAAQQDPQALLESLPQGIPRLPNHFVPFQAQLQPPIQRNDGKPVHPSLDGVLAAPKLEAAGSSPTSKDTETVQKRVVPTQNASSRSTAGKSGANKLPKPTTKVSKKKSGDKKTDNKQVGTSDFTLAAQPEKGGQFVHEPPVVDRAAIRVEPAVGDFGPTPVDPYQFYDPESEKLIYEGKSLNANRRPLIELGKPWYQLGQLKPSSTWLGAHNPVNEQFLIYGDYRMAYANAKNANRDYSSQLAFEWNMNLDLRLTGTERLTAFVAPLDRGADNTRWLFDEDRVIGELDFDINFGMLEGDLGAIVGGFTGQTLPFDLPFAVGVMPMLVQNGVWMDDAITGLAFTLPARNSPKLDISNMDLTFFAAYDEIDSPAFEGNNSAAKMYGFLGFIESFGGYWEIDYAFLEDRDFRRDRSYHNIGLAFTRRYGRFVSNSTRIIINAGQSTEFGPNTADGVLLLSENSLITSKPGSFVPYFNFWAGFDRPQSAARAGASGGVLRNTGILFESDGMTGFPTLDDSGNDTAGGSIGLNIMTPEWDQQLVVEFSFLKALGNDATRIAPGDQTGLGARYQLPLSNSWLLRSDVMYGFLENTSDVHGGRLELRHKF